MVMATETKHWTLAELHRLPDDGNKYELVRGVLFVTPAPTDPHETIAARIRHLLMPYVNKHSLGYMFSPRAVLMFEGSQVEPDVMVRQPHPDEHNPAWETAPTPSLVVEIASRTTSRRDHTEKRALYLDADVPEYWIVDGRERIITVVKPTGEDEVVRDAMSWQSHGVSEALCFNLEKVFGRKQMR